MSNVAEIMRALTAIEDEYARTGKTVLVAVTCENNEMTFYSEDGRGNGLPIFTISKVSLLSAIQGYKREKQILEQLSGE